MLAHFGRPEAYKIIVIFYLSPLSKTLIEKKTVPRLAKKIPVFYET